MSSECLPKFIYFSEEEFTLVQEHRIPRHVAIIMDGNRRWAKKRIVSKITNPLGGHWRGADILQPIIEASQELGVKVLTVYAFSTENWNRSPQEISTLLHIFETYLKKNRAKMIEQGVRFDVIGDLSRFSHHLRDEIEITRIATSGGQGINFVIAMNYGGRDEIKRATCSMIEDVVCGKLDREAITEEVISSYLDTAPYGDPDLLIRTGGEKRISNFLLWQLAYTEVHVTEILWPDFTPRDLLTAVIDFQQRERRKGQ